MASIKPFRGIRYNPQKVGHLSKVVAQPYDRVRYGLQERYYDQSPYNIVRMTKGRELTSDRPDRPEGPNVYTRARSYYELWRAEEVLIPEDKAAIYVYHQSFDNAKTRRGFIAAFELSPFGAGIVLPHEQTHAGPKVDRLRLLSTLPVNLGQIFMLYPDLGNQLNGILDAAIAGRAPDVELFEMYEQDVRQRLWVVTDQVVIDSVCREMSTKRNLIIADGHHRYETALAYREQMLKLHPDASPDAAFNHRMVTFVSMDDPGLVILPTHREIFDYPQLGVAELLARAERAFRVIPVPDVAACFDEMRANEMSHAFGLYADGRYHVLVLRSIALLDQWIVEPLPEACMSLDVSVAQKIVLQGIVGLSAEAIETQSNVRYHRDPEPAIESVNAGRGNFCLFLNPTRIDQVRTCAQHGVKMPQKSTDFYPKMISGLTLMSVGPEDRI
jgi:uncharacterized protein (DUF1015 family)